MTPLNIGMIAFLQHVFYIGIATLSCLLITVSNACGEQARQYASDDAEMSLQETTVTVDIVPLVSRPATQYVISPINQVQFFHYHPSNLTVTSALELKAQHKDVMAMRSVARSMVVDGSREPNPAAYPIEDDQYRMSFCNHAGQCESISGLLGEAPSPVKELINTLRNYQISASSIKMPITFLRCRSISDKRRIRIERRGYPLLPIDNLPSLLRKAVRLAIQRGYAFTPLNEFNHRKLLAFAETTQLYGISGDDAFECEFYDAVDDQP